jgi:predicted DNA-binding protein
MARPKGTAPRKKALNITVSEELRNKLDFISKQEGKSISLLVDEWAEKEFKRISKKSK